jgi:phospholipid/cholesterol/gamma-HCH transport system substrate-binding protein
MKKLEITVGLFIVSGLIAIFFLAFKVGQNQLVGQKTYELSALFSNLSGVSKNARVEIAGVRVGSVKSVELNDQFKAVATIQLPVSVELDEDTIAAVKTSGLIGDRYIELIPGGSGIALEAGDFIFDTQSALDLESLIGKFGLGDMTNDNQ